MPKMPNSPMTWVVIPARLNSARLPQKALHMIAGKPLIVRVVEGVQNARQIEKIIVATDHQSIVSVIQQNFQDPRVECVLTPPELPSGTDRCLNAISQFPEGSRPHRVLNIQGDEPLIDGVFVDELISAWNLNSGLNNKAQMMTAAKPLSSLEDLTNPNIVKVLLNQRSEAIYFSRFPIPFSRGLPAHVEGLRNPLHHIGVYGFEIEFLQKFCSASVSSIEQAESLEQLRALQLGTAIFVHLTDRKLIGVDTLDDVAKVEAYLKQNEKHQIS
jgi:3-deoxy-manno-octulosonate cytidylyltransferase (CMP-KDO synthetase)